MGDIMLIMRKRPIPGTRIEEGLRLSAAMLGMDHIPMIIFLDDGVESLLPDALYKNHLKDYLRAISDLARVYVVKESLEARGLTENELESFIKATFISFNKFIDMVKKCCLITSF